MKTEIKNIFQTILFLFCLLPVWVDAADYTVSTRTSTVDGDTFCGGSPCTSADTIIIAGGARGNLLFKDFNGNGKYITITNGDTNPDAKVVITTGSVGAAWAGLELRDCKYVDLKGNNDADLTYGIKVINDGTPEMVAAVRVRQESDHIKIGYVEIDGTSADGTGIMVHDTTLDESWCYNTFEIHHNYIYNVGYAGMYLGHNTPWSSYDPYTANFSIHDNLLEDMGCYGITMKGVRTDSGTCLIYNNTVKRTGVDLEGREESFAHGIGAQYFEGSCYANIYNNRIEHTVGPGLKIGDQNHKVYNNLILGCGTGNEEKWGHGITTYQSTSGTHIYDNIIIQPKRYGIYATGMTRSVTLSRNRIADAGIGEWDEEESRDVTESAGDDANWYESDVDVFNFKTWSDDGDYTNDNFSTSIVKPPQSLKITQ